MNKIMNILVVAGAIILNMTPKSHSQTPEELASGANAAFETASSANGTAVLNLETSLDGISADKGIKGTLEEIKADISAALHGKDKFSYHVEQALRKLEKEGLSMKAIDGTGIDQTFMCDLSNGYTASLNISGVFENITIFIALADTNVPVTHEKHIDDDYFDDDIDDKANIDSKNRRHLFWISGDPKGRYDVTKSPYYENVPQEIKNKFEKLTLIAMSLSGQHSTSVFDKAFRYISRLKEDLTRETPHYHYHMSNQVVTKHSFGLGSAGGVSGIMMETTNIYPGGRATKEWTVVGF